MPALWCFHVVVCSVVGGFSRVCPFRAHVTPPCDIDLPCPPALVLFVFIYVLFF